MEEMVVKIGIAVFDNVMKAKRSRRKLKLIAKPIRLQPLHLTVTSLRTYQNQKK